MKRYGRICRSTVATVGFVVVLLFGDVAGAQPVAARDPGAGLAARAATVDAPPNASKSWSPEPNVCREPPCTVPPPTITCRLRIDNPHRSSIDPDNIQVKARVNCTAPIGGMHLIVALFEGPNLLYWDDASNTKQAALSKTLTVPCDQTDFYSGAAEATLAAPPGYVPPVLVLYVESPEFLIIC